MTKATVTQGNLIRYGIFLAGARSFTSDHLIQDKLYKTEIEASAALNQLKKQVVHVLRNSMVVHLVEDAKVGEEENYSFMYLA